MSSLQSHLTVAHCLLSRTTPPGLDSIFGQTTTSCSDLEGKYIAGNDSYRASGTEVPDSAPPDLSACAELQLALKGCLWHRAGDLLGHSAALEEQQRRN